MKTVYLVAHRYSDEFHVYSSREVASAKAELLGTCVTEAPLDADAEILASGQRPYSVRFKRRAIITQMESEYVEGVSYGEPEGSVMISLIAHNAEDATRRALKIYKNLKDRGEREPLGGGEE